MTVSVDTTTTSTRTNTDTTINFTHAGGTNGPYGTGLKGVVVIFTVTGSNADDISTVTYAGNTMTRICRGAADSGAGTEPGSAVVYFLGSQVGAVPEGSQTVSYTLGTATTDDYFVTCTTLFGIGNLEIQSSNTYSGPAISNPTLLLQTGGNNCLGFCGFYSGLNAPPSAPGDTTSLGSIDFGTQSGLIVRQTTASTTNFTFSFTSALDDVALAGITIREHPIQIYTKADGTWYPAALNVYATGWKTAAPFVKINGRWIS